MIIYGLSSSEAPGLIRYVGRTSQPLKRRVANHISESLGDEKQTHKARWIRSVLAEGHRVLGSVIAWGSTDEELNQLECHYIAHFRDLGFSLTNSTDGGDGVVGLHHTEESRRQMSAVKMGHPRNHPPGWKHSEESKQKMSAALKGQKRSDETRERLRIAKTGTKHSDEPRRKMSDAHTGKTLTDEHRQHISEVTRGRKFSAEHRAKMGEAQARRWAKARENGPIQFSDEHRRKLSDAAKGKPKGPFSEAHRQSMREGQLRRQARERALAQAPAALLM